MQIKPAILCYFLGRTKVVTIIALIAASLFVLLYTGILSRPPPLWLPAFILVHSLAVSMCLNRFRSAHLRFLYTRGFSRDQLWKNKIAAAYVSVLLVWLPASLILWLHLRSSLQDSVFQNPFFPLFTTEEFRMPLFWLAEYVVLIAIFDAVGASLLQPQGGGSSLLHGMLSAGIVAFGLYWAVTSHDRFVWVAGSTACIFFVVSLARGFLLHRTMELRKVQDYSLYNYTSTDGKKVKKPLSPALSFSRRISFRTGLILWAGIAGVLVYGGVEKYFLPEEDVEKQYKKGNEIKIQLLPHEDNLQGVEVWFQHVKLGELPYKTKKKEFLEKLSGTNFKKDYLGTVYNIFTEDKLSTEQENGGMFYPSVTWYYSGDWRPFGQALYPLPFRKRLQHYVTVKVKDEWAHVTRVMSFGASEYIGVAFPRRRKQVVDLLDSARLENYQPGAAWFEAAGKLKNTITEQIFIHIHNEPKWDGLLESWAQYTYGSENISSREQAWKVFETICKEAQRKNYYLPFGIEGKAVEILIPWLDPHKIAQNFVRLLNSNSLFVVDVPWKLDCGTLIEQIK
jgi:hypothetical protein